VLADGESLPRGSDPDEWRVLLTLDETPVARVRLPDPGEADEAFRRAALDLHAAPHRAYFELLERMRRRLGVPDVAPPAVSCSVVVCTRQRPEMLAGLLAAVALLDPAPLELIVVDNDPGELDVREPATAAGARYIREDRRGLDNARSTGLAAARGDVVAFTDDDCLPSVRWLRNLPELFDDPRVAAVTGPAFAHELDSAAKLAFEDSGGFGRGFNRRVHEWTGTAPAAAGQAGAGANMIVRRSVAQQLGELFPPELDAGSPTESGGDHYALYRLLAAGYRVVYDPGTYVFHRHRADMKAMRNTFRGYGVGLSATLTKLLVEHRELATPAVWRWLVTQYVEALTGDQMDRQIARDYLSGGLRGPLAWLRAKREAHAPAPPPAAVRRPPAPAQLNPAEHPDVSVIVTTHHRPQALRHCLDALACQAPGTPPVEVRVVNDGSAPVEAIDAVRVVASGCRGTAAARNVGAATARGSLLLFLDDDLVPEADLVMRHAEAHRDTGERVTIGYCEPQPRRRNLASLGAAAWWEDHYRALRGAASLTFMDMLSGNMSVPRLTFGRLGGFDPQLERREDWEWGIRVLQAGVEVSYEPRARAAHQFGFSPRRALAASRQHGRSDAVLIARYPDTVAALPVRWAYRDMLRRPLKAALFLATQSRAGRRLGLCALSVLEEARARPSWSRLFTLMLGASYEQGRREGGDPRRPAEPPPVLEIELNSDEPVPAPQAMAPRVRLLSNGERVAELSTRGGHWGAELAERIAAAGGACSGNWELGTGNSSPAVVIALDGTADGAWMAQAADALGAERVALAIGAGLPEGEPPAPLTLHSRAMHPEAFPLFGRPPVYVALRRDVYGLLGGFDADGGGLGSQAAVLDLIERALEAGWLVARRDVPGAGSRSERVASLTRTRARAALLARRARARGKLPSARPALARLAAGLVPGGPTFSGGVAHAAAWLAGTAAGVGYADVAPPATAEPWSGTASQRCPGRSMPLPAERPVTRSG
jgi:GT2 family glycosyltransferase